MKGWQWILVGIVIAALITGGAAATEVIIVDSRKLTVSQIYELAASAGFVGADLITAVSIALAESGGDPGALGDITAGFSYGLWQINARWHPEFGPNFETLYDPAVNASAAYRVYREAGNSFQPWSTFKSGAYAQYVTQVQAIANA